MTKIMSICMSEAKIPQSKILEEQHTQTRRCAVDGCCEEGCYPAPRTREKLRDYLWFCLEHVRAYNKSWNYFNGLQGAALEAEIQNATTWERPSWRFGTGTGGAGSFHAGMMDEAEDIFGLFGTRQEAERAQAYASMDREERAAWKVFDMDPVSDPSAIKRRYNELAKQNHPDHNQGDPLAEERLKEINLAYSTLRKKRVNPQSSL